MAFLEVVRSAIMGHIVGDTVGVPVEFCLRDKLKKHPVDDMLSFGTHKMPKGTWSDDSSMVLCTLESIAQMQTLDLNDMMQRFSNWARTGYMTPFGKPFGVGRSTLRALGKYWRGITPTCCGCSSERDNGNGSLMRILPICLYNVCEAKSFSTKEKISNIHAASSLTHAHSRTCVACGVYYFVFEELLKEQSKLSVLKGLANANRFYAQSNESWAYTRLFSKEFAVLREKDINSSGYVVDTIEAAIWSILHASDYRETILCAVNMGGDTDTVAAIAGGLAGIMYGYEQIPSDWIESIAHKDMILSLCNRFAKAIEGGE